MLQTRETGSSTRTKRQKCLHSSTVDKPQVQEQNTDPKESQELAVLPPPVKPACTPSQLKQTGEEISILYHPSELGLERNPVKILATTEPVSVFKMSTCPEFGSHESTVVWYLRCYDSSWNDTYLDGLQETRTVGMHAQRTDTLEEQSPGPAPSKQKTTTWYDNKTTVTCLPAPGSERSVFRRNNNPRYPPHTRRDAQRKYATYGKPRV